MELLLHTQGKLSNNFLGIVHNLISVIHAFQLLNGQIAERIGNLRIQPSLYGGARCQRYAGNGQIFVVSELASR
ncbi:hypothetical protein D3C78_1482950 [compost metagenome]